MSPLTLGVAALALGALVGFSVVIGAPVFALPVVLLAGALGGAGALRRRRERVRELRTFREEAKAEPVDFTERDKLTTVESAI